jgi:hypothetical protein
LRALRELQLVPFPDDLRLDTPSPPTYTLSRHSRAIPMRLSSDQAMMVAL